MNRAPAMAIMLALGAFILAPETALGDQNLIQKPLFHAPSERGELDVSKLMPECRPVQCNVDVWILAVDDLTGDNLPDLLLGTTMFDKKWREANKAGPIVLMRNDGNGKSKAISLADGELFVLRKHPREAVVADFNGDGLKDVFVVSNCFDVSPWPGEENLLLVQEGGTLRDATADLPRIKAMHHGAAAADFNSDGHQDLLVITNHGATRVDSYILVNDRSGKFTKSDLSDRFPVSFLKNESGSKGQGQIQHRSRS